MAPQRTNTASYEGDFYAWANEQAGLLRAGRLAEADIAHIAEEIETMGKSEKRELISRLTVLLQHLLKWQYQPMLHGQFWRATIRIQRRDLTVHLDDNPSLKSILPHAIAQAYGNALIGAEAETGLPEAIFPPLCPWTFERLMDSGFWPEQ